MNTSGSTSQADVFTLTDSEQRELQDLETLSMDLNNRVFSLQNKGYLDKKIALINQAKIAIQYSHNVESKHLLQVCNPQRDGKLLSTSIGVYKKQRCIEREAIVWEMSILLGCSEWIAPSIPIHIYGELATFQPYIPDLQVFDRFLPQSYRALMEFSQVDFWKLAIFSFLVGFSDLNGKNLHHNQSKFILVDNDWSFPKNNDLIYTENQLVVPLMNGLLDFEKAQVPLNEEDALQVNLFINNLRLLRNEIDIFLSSPYCASVSQSSQNAFWQRFILLTQNMVSPSTTLEDFARERFPQYYEIADGIRPLIKNMTGVDWGPFSLLHMTGPFLKFMSQLSDNQKKEIHQWLGSNVPLAH